MIPDFDDVEPLEDGLPFDSVVAEEGADAPTTGELPVPDGFIPADPIDLDDLPIDPD